MIVHIRTNTGKKMIGELWPAAKVFQKKVKLSKHLFQKLDAWGIDAQYFTDVLLPENYYIRVIDEEGGFIYATSAQKMNKLGQFYHFKKENADYRAQIFLSRRHWIKVKVGTNNQSQ